MTTAMITDPGHDDDRELPDCDSCAGTGYIDIGDCEDGVTDECPACGGTGKRDEGDEFVPERDAWTAND